MGAARRALQLRVCGWGDRDQSPPLAPLLLLRTDVIPIPREYAWDRDDPREVPPSELEFRLGDTTHRWWPGRKT